MVKKINAVKARQNLGDLLEKVYHKGDQYVIERAGKAMAAVVPLAQFEAWQRHREAFFKTTYEMRVQCRDVEAELLEKEISEAVQAAKTDQKV